MASGDKNNKTGQRTTASKRNNQKNNTKQQGTGIYAIILFAFSVLFLCIVLIPSGPEGGLWGVLREIIFGVFGFCAFVLPLLFIYLTVISVLEKDFSRISLKIIDVVVLVFLIATAISVFSSQGKIDFSDALRDAYDTYKLEGSVLGSGVIGSMLGFLFLTITGWSKAAAGAIVLILIFVFLMLLTGLTLAKFFKGMWTPVEKAKTFAEEKHEEYVTERNEIKKSNKKIDDIDPATDLTPEKNVNDIYTLDESDKGIIPPKTTKGKKSSSVETEQDVLTEKTPSAVIDDIIKRSNANAEEKSKQREIAKMNEEEFAKEVDDNTDKSKKSMFFRLSAVLKKATALTEF